MLTISFAKRIKVFVNHPLGWSCSSRLVAQHHSNIFSQNDTSGKIRNFFVREMVVCYENARTLVAEGMKNCASRIRRDGREGSGPVRLQVDSRIRQDYARHAPLDVNVRH